MDMENGNLLTNQMAPQGSSHTVSFEVRNGGDTVHVSLHAALEDHGVRQS